MWRFVGVDDPDRHTAEVLTKEKVKARVYDVVGHLLSNAMN